MKRTLVIGLILVVLLACTGVASANLVTNGGFETPAIPDASWDIFPDGTPGLDWDVQWAVNPGPDGRPDIANAELQSSGLLTSPDYNGGTLNAFEGRQYAELDTDWNGPDNEPPVVGVEQSNVIMSQDIVTNAGKTYIISWEQRRRADDTHNPSELEFSWNGDGPVVTTGVAADWTKYTYERVASGATSTISFTGAEDSDSFGALIDDVIVVEKEDIPVPEFPTMALPAALIVGMLGAVLFIQRTKED
jgi:hypothetical protein